MVVAVEAVFAVVNVIVTLFVLVVCRCCCCCSFVVVVAVLLLVVVVGASMKETLSPSSSIRPIQRFAGIRDAAWGPACFQFALARSEATRKGSGRRPRVPQDYIRREIAGWPSNTWTVEDTGRLM